MKTTAICLILASLAVAGCKTTGIEYTSDKFIAIKVSAGDTFVSLAEKYLGDSSKDWLISEFNGRADLKTGESILIPLTYFNKGGFRANGYQVVPVLHYMTDDDSFSMAYFSEQMSFLAERPYRVIPGNDLVDFVHYRNQIPENSVVLVFTGDILFFYESVYPVVKSMGFPVTFFIDPEHITWKENTVRIKELVENGVSIQSCAGYRIMKPDDFSGDMKKYFFKAARMIRKGKKKIEAKTGRPCNLYLCPDGKENNLIVTLLQKHGYKGAFTEKGRNNPFFNNPYQLGIHTINGPVPDAEYKEMLTTFQKLEVN